MEAIEANAGYLIFTGSMIIALGIMGWNWLNAKNREQAEKSGAPRGNASGEIRNRRLNRGKKH